MGIAKRIAVAALLIALFASTAFAQVYENVSSVTIYGKGTVSDPDTHGAVYRVVLPTAQSLDFVLDVRTGAITHKNEPAAVVNESSVDVELTVTIHVTGNAVAVTAPSAVEADAKPNVLLKLTASSGASAADYTLSKTARTLSMTLGRADYGDNGFIAGTGHGAEFRIGGSLNRRADWSGFADGGTSAVGVEATFAFRRAVGGVDYGLPPAMSVDPAYSLAASVDGAMLSITSDGLTFPPELSHYRIDRKVTHMFPGDWPPPKGVSVAADGTLTIELPEAWIDKWAGINILAYDVGGVDGDSLFINVEKSGATLSVVWYYGDEVR